MSDDTEKLYASLDETCEKVMNEKGCLVDGDGVWDARVDYQVALIALAGGTWERIKTIIIKFQDV